MFINQGCFLGSVLSYSPHGTSFPPDPCAPAADPRRAAGAASTRRRPTSRGRVPSASWPSSARWRHRPARALARTALFLATLVSERARFGSPRRITRRPLPRLLRTQRLASSGLRQGPAPRSAAEARAWAWAWARGWAWARPRPRGSFGRTTWGRAPWPRSMSAARCAPWPAPPAAARGGRHAAVPARRLGSMRDRCRGVSGGDRA